jgi:hypothetical protein
MRTPGRRVRAGEFQNSRHGSVFQQRLEHRVVNSAANFREVHAGRPSQSIPTFLKMSMLYLSVEKEWAARRNVGYRGQLT